MLTNKSIVQLLFTIFFQMFILSDVENLAGLY